MRRIGLAVVLTLAVASPLTAQRTFRIVPPSGPLAVGASHTLTFTATDAAGRDMGRRRMAVTCGSLDAVASMDGVRVKGEAAGTARVVCIWQGIADMVALTVGTPAPAPDPEPPDTATPTPPAPDPDPGADPRPGPNDRILFDTRTSLQNATSETAALGLFGYTKGIRFSRNFDGRGTNALRVEWRDWGGRCSEQTSLIEQFFSRSPRRIYMQWKMRMGRHPADRNTSHGQVDQFAITNGSCGSGGNAGRKMMIMARGNPATNAHAGNKARTDIIWGGPAPSRFSVRLDTEGVARYADWLPERNIARDLTITVYYEASSAEGRNDGRIRAWVNGARIMDVAAPMDALGFHGFHLPSVFNSPRFAQTEYLWDIVVWTPEN